MGVLGIGGLFFRAADPEALASWYRTHLGIGAGCSADPDVEANEWVWATRAGPMVFAPMPAATDYFAADKQFMINLRVEGLDAMLTALRGAGIAVIADPAWDSPEAGRFARIHDPEGNAIELWEPATS